MLFSVTDYEYSDRLPSGEELVQRTAGAPACVRSPPAAAERLDRGCQLQSHAAALCGVRSRLPHHLEDGLDPGLGPIVLNEMAAALHRPPSRSIA